VKIKPNEAGFIAAPDINLGSDLIGKLVAFRPTRTEVVETKIGPSEAVYALTLEISDDGGYVSHGEHPVFWSVVRKQLAAATAEAPWVVGRLSRHGQAYRLDAPTEDEALAFGTALADYADF
jgi:hypothetical protein